MSEFEMPDESVDPAVVVPHSPRAVAYVPDLIDQSKIAAALAGVHFVRRPEDLEGRRAELVIVDLGRPGVLDVLATVHAERVIGFASHVDGETLAGARAAGCDAMRRSEFFRRLPELAV